MPGRVEGKVAFITGAARGQGRAHAVRLAQEGADIIAIDICKQLDTVPIPMSTPEDLDETVAQVKAAGRRIVAAQVDVRDYDGLKAAVDDGVTQLGRLDIVVANAGLAADGAPIQDLDEKLWRDSIDVNLTGVFHTGKAAIPHLIAGGRGGAIVLTSSVGGLKAHPNIANYVAGKHGVVGLMRSMAVELAQYDIRVNSVHPTQVGTPMLLNDLTYRMFRPDLENPTQEDMAPISQMMNALPVPWVEAEDIANAVLFLVSDEARYITGVPLPIDAGSMLK
ncbi:mycofactocin-coupled SDR family oxidoreductase [Actinomadura montaniterrae]|uniref:Mycofactocin-coupled SDR family oxidoreductase n=1 Tax=Actinomadura montaniterrae TaxID=1803903 RepID=A0A6L3VWQ6_9ACTN|nr:mycofactocin-coupled SDR family oxidoreductase [Actinomadura montaniterrae]KAB2375038.1 mycofactocin-coupled SDR family oxidoreductase [Actinomadura montaniterrae]